MFLALEASLTVPHGSSGPSRRPRGSSAPSGGSFLGDSSRPSAPNQPTNQVRPLALVGSTNFSLPLTNFWFAFSFLLACFWLASTVGESGSNLNQGFAGIIDGFLASHHISVERVQRCTEWLRVTLRYRCAMLRGNVARNGASSCAFDNLLIVIVSA
jgi:hypothetical protein